MDSDGSWEGWYDRSGPQICRHWWINMVCPSSKHVYLFDNVAVNLIEFRSDGGQNNESKRLYATYVQAFKMFF